MDARVKRVGAPVARCVQRDERLQLLVLRVADRAGSDPFGHLVLRARRFIEGHLGSVFHNPGVVDAHGTVMARSFRAVKLRLPPNRWTHVTAPVFADATPERPT